MYFPDRGAYAPYRGQRRGRIRQKLTLAELDVAIICLLT